MKCEEPFKSAVQSGLVAVQLNLHVARTPLKLTYEHGTVNAVCGERLSYMTEKGKLLKIEADL